MKEHDLLQTIKREGKFGGVGDGSEMSRGGKKVGSGKGKRQWDRRCLGQGKERIFLSFLLIGMQEFRGEEDAEEKGR